MGVLDGKIAVVTGAGRGIGREIALGFAREGAAVVVNDLGGAADGSGTSRVADEVVAEIRAAGGVATANYDSVARVEVATANYDSVATVEGGKAIFQCAIDEFGALDVLVNNAGILRDRTIFKMEEEDWDTVIAVHLKGHYCCVRPFARYIRETSRQGCRIVNFSSVSGLWGNFGQSNYGAAKTGIVGLSRILALELAKYGCTVNTISPGAATRLTIDLIKGAGGEVDVDDPLTGPQQLAPVVTWLASSAGQDVTSQIIHVSNGIVGIMQQPALIRAFENDHLWTLDELDKIIPQLVEARTAADERVKQEAEPSAL